MADEAAETQSTETKKGKIRLLMVVVVALLMGVEGLGMFMLARAIGPDPAPALAAAGSSAPDADDAEDLAEIELAESRPNNKLSGKFITFHIRVSALVSSDDLDRVKQLVRVKRARLEDGVNTVIRSAQPKHFNEPGYDTLKRRLKHEFDRIFGDDELVKEVLIPQLLQSGPGV
jgi:flagellar basal body-associated protein FliL